jgi:two-component system, response regulator YesN
MLKVFLAEDEIEVREGIKDSIDWMGEGFKFCGDAPDGELAYPLIQWEKPDIIITDIRMPFMNGLELSHLVKREFPKSKIIILSGYEEFKYAQEAIQIGVTEYLLKPIKSTELMKAVKKVRQQIILERMEGENSEFYKHEMEENETYLKRRFFNEMIEGSISIAEIISHGKELGLELSAKYYQVVLLQYNIVRGEETYSKELLTLNRELCSINSNFINIVLFDRGIDGIALLIKGNTLPQIDVLREEHIARVKAIFARYPSVHYFGGIGEVVDRLTCLSASFEKAARAFSYRFITSKNAIINYMDLFAQGPYEDFDSSLSTIELGGLDLKKVDGFLRSGGTSEITFFVEEFLKSISGTSKKSFLFKQYVLINIYLTVVTFLREIGILNITTEEPFTEDEQMYEKIYDQGKAREYIIRIFTTAIERRDELRSKTYRLVIAQAKEYINLHYADENISLNEIASHVNISPSHFSVVFSRETGKSFIKYLTDLRMNKAKELLKCTDMRCSDICGAVGYKDPHYFSYLFKKLHNCSPVQYRASIG